MLLKLWAGLLSFLTFFQFSNGPQQPNGIPETRTAPSNAAEYSIDFSARAKPWWLSPWLLEQFYQLNVEDGTRTDSLLVLHNGKLVYESYGEGWDAGTLHGVASVTKTVTSALVGIAIADGFIKSVDDKLVEYFPDADITIAPEWKREITVEHLLTMTSGFVDDSGVRFADLLAMGLSGEEKEGIDRRFEEDTIKAGLELCSMADEPGKRWAYSSFGVDILLGLVARAIDRPLADYVDEKLFGPLGITHYKWYTFPDGTYEGSSDLLLTSRDMARFGLLYMNYGRWEDRQIIPADWVAQTPSRSMNAGAYGRLVWNFKFAPFFGFYEAYGSEGQCIDILPGLGLVLVRTGSRV